MGFFSSGCQGCHHSIRHRGACQRGPGGDSLWMAKIVCVMAGGSIVKDSYDGYGHGAATGATVISFPMRSKTVWHLACWNLSGNPTDRREAVADIDQGHFVGEYAPAEPKTLDDLAKLRKYMDTKIDAAMKMADESAKKWKKIDGNNKKLLKRCVALTESEKEAGIPALIEAAGDSVRFAALPCRKCGVNRPSINPGRGSVCCFCGRSIATGELVVA